MKKLRTKDLATAGVVITLMLLVWMISEIILKGYHDFSSLYNMNPTISFTLLLLGEVFFDSGLLIMIIGSQIIKKPSLKHLFVLDFKHIVFNNSKVYIGFVINRLGDFLFPIYFLAVANFRLPSYILLLLMIDISLSVIITLIPIVYLERKGVNV